MIRRSAVIVDPGCSEHADKAAALAQGLATTCRLGCAPYCQTFNRIANGTFDTFQSVRNRRQAGAGSRRLDCQTMSPKTSTTGGKTSQFTSSQPFRLNVPKRTKQASGRG